VADVLGSHVCVLLRSDGDPSPGQRLAEGQRSTPLASVPIMVKTMAMARAIAEAMKAATMFSEGAAATGAGPTIWPMLYQDVSFAEASATPICVPMPIVIMTTPMNVKTKRAAEMNRTIGEDPKTASRAPTTWRL